MIAAGRWMIVAALSLAGCAPPGADRPREASSGAFAGSGEASGVLAPTPLYRDPVSEGAADPLTVFDPATGEWVMYYTNRRANFALEDPADVIWVHGTRTGITRSADGVNWRYAGTADLPPSCTGATHWGSRHRGAKTYGRPVCKSDLKLAAGLRKRIRGSRTAFANSSGIVTNLGVAAQGAARCHHVPC